MLEILLKNKRGSKKITREVLEMGARAPVHRSHRLLAIQELKKRKRIAG